MNHDASGTGNDKAWQLDFKNAFAFGLDQFQDYLFDYPSDKTFEPFSVRCFISSEAFILSQKI